MKYGKALVFWVLFMMITPITIYAAALTVETTGTGSGVVASSPEGISCGGSEENIARNKPVTALTDSVEGSPENIVDGLCTVPSSCPADSFWYSYQECGTSYNRFVIDLLSSPPIASLHFYPLQIYSYTIWTSDNNADWTERHTDSTGPYATDITIPVNGAYSARYIKYEGANTTCGYAGMGEFEVNIFNDCFYDFNAGTEITLTATANADSVFAGWSNGTGSASSCTGTQSCTFTITDDSALTAIFTKPTLSSEEGTIGSQLTITGLGFGDKKGKVLIGEVATKIAKEDWADDSITCTLNKVPPEGTHNVTIKPYKADDIPLPNAFSVKAPRIDLLDFSHEVPGEPITITGKFFGSKKGKVYLEDPATEKKKTCKVTYWHMDETSGDSTATFLVPKLPKAFSYGTEYLLKLTNKVGTDDTTFTVDLPSQP